MEQTEVVKIMIAKFKALYNVILKSRIIKIKYRNRNSKRWQHPEKLKK